MFPLPTTPYHSITKGLLFIVSYPQQKSLENILAEGKKNSSKSIRTGVRNSSYDMVGYIQC